MSSSSDEGSRTPTPQDAAGPRKNGNSLQRSIKQETDCLVRIALSGAENNNQEYQMKDARSKRLDDYNSWEESKLQPGSYAEEFSPKNGRSPKNKYGNRKCAVQSFQKKEFTFSMSGDPDNIQYAFTADPSYTLLSALNTSCDFEEKVKSDNTILAYGEGPLRGLVNLDIRCRYLPQHSHFRLLFLRTQSREGSGVGSERPLPPECPRGESHVLFYVEPSGRTAGNNAQRIVLADRIAQGQTKLCVLGFQGETIREALANDGRFDAKVEDDSHKLLEKVDPPRKIQFNNMVDGLHGRSFQVELSGPRRKATTDDGGKSPKPRAGESAARLARKELESRGHEGARCLLPRWHLEARRASLSRLKQLVSRNAELANVSERQYLNRHHQEALAPVPARAFRCISSRLSSVGCVTWKNSAALGSGTCFVLGERYLLTCYHVVEMMTEGAAPGTWPTLVRDCTEVFFGYEEDGRKGQPLKLAAWLEIYDQALDYAVLELESSPGAPGLLQLWASPPQTGTLYITGHPEGDKKKICPCVVVTGYPKASGYTTPDLENLRAGVAREEAEDYTHETVLIASQAFNRLKYSNVITYKTEFHYGAAGSPIFNSEGSLVALHCGGEIYRKNKDPEKFYIELGRPIPLILHDIISKSQTAATEKSEQLIATLQHFLMRDVDG
ncbi:serine protease FAM111A-like isoform X1 [Rhincodon typus]|uniref:serine protease FAM111A-like isoform X1 n=2 Tax=Rhincodon typus TaxID=259920 RepID=UPI00202FBE81|nr:serine protease FAM111A-like isoform X1 [Rhincodon typus]